MSDPTQLVFHQLAPARTISDVTRLYDAFEQQGYRLIDIYVRCMAQVVDGGWKTDELCFGDSIHDATDGILQHKNLFCLAVDAENGLELSVSVSWNPAFGPINSILYASTHQRRWLMDGSDERPEHDSAYFARHLLDLGKALYTATSANFGWIDYGPPEIMPSDEELRDYRLRGVYWANFFSRDFVKRIGTERFSDVPYGWIEPLPDGGALCVLTPTFVGGWRIDVHGPINRHFGFETIE